MKDPRLPEDGSLHPPSSPTDVVVVNARCCIRTCDGHRVVTVSSVPLAHYAVGDRVGEAHAMVILVEQGWALQCEVARAFGCTVRTVRRNSRRVEEGGLAALGRPAGYPRGRQRLSRSRYRRVLDWKAQGIPNRRIAERLGVTEKAVRKTLKRLGWKGAPSAQRELPFASTDPNVSAESPGTGPTVAIDRSQDDGSAQIDAGGTPGRADPNLSASTGLPVDLPVSLDTDPEDRCMDRLLAHLGALDDAAPMFGEQTEVAGAGVLLAIPALLESRVFEVAREVYGSLGPAFYGLRTTVLTLLLMALLRIRRPEGLKERSPRSFGRILGLDRAPEVKTLRRKLERLAAARQAASFGRALAEQRVATRGRAMGFLYVDGHVRVYHGMRPLPKTHVARMRISLPSTTEYWVNDATGEPLFVVPTEANPGLVAVLPPILDEVRRLVGERRVTVVFDRGGWSPRLFQKLITAGFDVLTYRKGRFPRVARKRFVACEATLDGQVVRYVLADQGVRFRSGLRLRQVTRLAEDGHQTPIVTSRRDLSAIEVAYRMFSRWRQENFFKYLREEYALDALVEYEVESADPARIVPNPARTRIDSVLKRARAALGEVLAQYGVEAFTSAEVLRRTMRGFKIANALAAREVLAALKRVTGLERQRANIPARLPIGVARPEETVKLAVERGHLVNLLKMVAYQAEGDLLRMVTPHYSRAEDEGRTLIQNALGQSGDIKVVGDELRVAIDPLSSPHRTRALAALCVELTAARVRFPGTSKRLVFTVKPSPKPSPAFPGPSVAQTGSDDAKPDILAGG